MAIGECADDTGTPPNLFHDPLEPIVGADLLPVDVGKGIVSLRRVNAALEPNRPRYSSWRPAGQVFNDRPRFAVGRVAVLLGMYSLEHVAHLANSARRYVTERFR